MAEIQVLMVGGKRCGKSSILASSIQFLNNNKILNDSLKIRPTGTVVEGGVSLNRKYAELMAFVYGKTNNKYYLVDFNADNKFSKYPFKIGVRKTLGNFTVKFIDAPGESYDPELWEYIEMREYAKGSDVFVIAIDTPYLMDGNPGYAQIVNCIPNLISLFKGDDEDNSNPILKESGEKVNKKELKFFMFVPVKCEAYKNRMNEVVSKVKSAYSGLIDELLRHKECCISIIPAFTAGGIEFAEFSDPKLLINKEDRNIDLYKKYGKELSEFRCNKLTKSTVRMGNGDIEEIEEYQTVISDEEFVLRVPQYSWYKSTGEYLPKNCEQIILHALRFVVSKKKINKETSIFGLKLSTLEDALKTISVLIKDEGDGITHIRSLNSITL